MMTKKLIVISDLHLHPWAAFSTGSHLDNSRLLQSCRVLEKSLKAARDNDAIWVFPGDIVHTHGHVQNIVLTRLTQILQKYPEVTKVAVWGNHDARGIGSQIILQETVWYALVGLIPGLHVLDSETWTSPEGIVFYGAGYQPKLEFLEPGPGGDVGIFHQTVEGTKNAFGYVFEDGVDSSVLSELYPTVLVGHVHHPAEYVNEDTQQLLLVPGSPEHHNFGDMGEHGYWCLTLEQKDKRWRTIETQLISSDSPKFISVEKAEEVKSDGNFYRVIGELVRPQDLPENAVVVGSPPTVVEQRDILKGSFAPEHVLRIWLKENPPQTGDVRQYLETGLSFLKAADPTLLQDYRLVYMRGSNFGSYEGFEHDITPGVHLVLGQSKDFKSNGAGKTTLFEAIFWAITGETTKGQSGNSVIRWGADKAEVELWLDSGDGDTRIRIIRSRSKSGPQLTVTRNGVPFEAESTTELTQKLMRHLGLTKNIYKVLAYFSQRNLVLFSDATDGDRKTIARDLTGAEVYQNAATEAGQFASQERQKEAALKARLEEMEKSLEQLAQLHAKAEEDEFSWEKLRRGRIDELTSSAILVTDHLSVLRTDSERRLDRIRSRMLRLTTLYSRACFAQQEELVEQRLPAEIASIEHKIEEHKRTIAKLEGSLVEAFGSMSKAQGLVANIDAVGMHVRALKNSRLEKQGELNKVSSFRNEKLREQQVVASERGRCQIRLELARNERDSILAGEGKCSKCGQPYTDQVRQVVLDEAAATVAAAEVMFHDNERVFVENEKEIERLTAQVETLTQEIVDLDASIQEKTLLWEKLNRGQVHLNSLEEADRAIMAEESSKLRVREYVVQSVAAELERKSLAYQARLERRFDRADHFVKKKEAELTTLLQNLKKEKEDKEKEVNPHSGTVAHYIRVVEDQEKAVASTRLELETTIQNLTRYTYWSEAFGKRGIQSLLMDEVATAFNAHRTEIFPLLTKGVYDVQFSTVSTTRGGEAREKTDFLIWQNGTPVDYADLSGGQQRRIDLGVMLTLALATAEKHNVPGVLGIMVLDEVFGFLDDDGAETLYTALSALSKKIPSIFAITHDPLLQSMFPDVIKVEQGPDGISRLVA